MTIQNSKSQQQMYKRAQNDIEDRIKSIRSQLSDQLKVFDHNIENREHITKDIAEFFKKKSEIELEYSKNLNKLCDEFIKKIVKRYNLNLNNLSRGANNVSGSSTLNSNFDRNSDLRLSSNKRRQAQASQLAAATAAAATRFAEHSESQAAPNNSKINSTPNYEIPSKPINSFNNPYHHLESSTPFPNASRDFDLESESGMSNISNTLNNQSVMQQQHSQNNNNNNKTNNPEIANDALANQAQTTSMFNTNNNSNNLVNLSNPEYFKSSTINSLYSSWFYLLQNLKDIAKEHDHSSHQAHAIATSHIPQIQLSQSLVIKELFLIKQNHGLFDGRSNGRSDKRSDGRSDGGSDGRSEGRSE